jgi:hypothetical protein
MSSNRLTGADAACGMVAAVFGGFAVSAAKDTPSAATLSDTRTVSFDKLRIEHSLKDPFDLARL